MAQRPSGFQGAPTSPLCLNVLRFLLGNLSSGEDASSPASLRATNAFRTRFSRDAWKDACDGVMDVSVLEGTTDMAEDWYTLGLTVFLFEVRRFQNGGRQQVGS